MGGGGVESQYFLKGKYKGKLEFPKRWEGQTKTSFRGKERGKEGKNTLCLMECYVCPMKLNHAFYASSSVFRPKNPSSFSTRSKILSQGSFFHSSKLW